MVSKELRNPESEMQRVLSLALSYDRDGFEEAVTELSYAEDVTTLTALARAVRRLQDKPEWAEPILRRVGALQRVTAVERKRHREEKFFTRNPRFPEIIVAASDNKEDLSQVGSQLSSILGFDPSLDISGPSQSGDFAMELASGIPPNDQSDEVLQVLLDAGFQEISAESRKSRSRTGYRRREQKREQEFPSFPNSFKFPGPSLTTSAALDSAGLEAGVDYDWVTSHFLRISNEALDTDIIDAIQVDGGIEIGFASRSRTGYRREQREARISVPAGDAEDVVNALHRAGLVARIIERSVMKFNPFNLPGGGEEEVAEIAVPADPVVIMKVKEVADRVVGGLVAGRGRGEPRAESRHRRSEQKTTPSDMETALQQFGFEFTRTIDEPSQFGLSEIDEWFHARNDDVSVGVEDDGSYAIATPDENLGTGRGAGQLRDDLQQAEDDGYI